MIVLQKLQGDASTRRFFRLKDKNETFVKIQYNTENPELIRQFERKQKLFNSCKVPVPEIYNINLPEFSIIVSDLGTTHLADLNLQEDSSIYAKLIDIIIKYQQVNLEFEDKFTKELFIEELIKTYRYFALANPDIRDRLSKNFEDLYIYSANKLVDSMLEQNFKLLHRDLHSRNIMIKDAELFLIDFQDARLGPYTYDLASVFVDPYNIFTAQKSIIDKDFIPFLKLYAEKMTIDYNTLIKDYKITAMQRLLKMLGTFSFLAIEYGKSEYLNYIPSTVGKLKLLIDSDFTEWEFFKKECL